tara:strand:+ start:1047 stop:1439 length:393 start_codon:yes stop_codon:yes gene_type:complete
MENGQPTIKLLGKDYSVVLPGFAEREDIAISYQTEDKHPRRQQRALVGALGLCVPAFNLGGLEVYEGLDLDLVKYGGRVYSAMMAQGHKRPEIVEASIQCFHAVCTSLFPRVTEVDKTENFTDQPGAVQT